MSLKLKLKIAIIVMVVNALACATTGDIPVVKQPEEAAKVLSESLISILKKITITEKVTVAIMPFGGPKGKPTTFGKKMADLIQAKLLGYQWILVERNRIDSIIKEKTLITAGVIEEKNFIETDGSVLYLKYLHPDFKASKGGNSSVFLLYSKEQSIPERVIKISNYFRPHRNTPDHIKRRYGRFINEIRVLNELKEKRKNNIIEIDEKNMQVITEPGVITQVLMNAVKEKGLF